MLIKIVAFLCFGLIVGLEGCQPPANCGSQTQYQPQQTQYQSQYQQNSQYQPQITIQPPFSTQNFNFPTPSSQPLNCIFSTDSQTSTYDCSSTNTTIKAAGGSFNSIDGSHTSNHSNYDVNGLKISSQICHFIPTGLSRLLPKLKKLEITYSGLLSVDETDTTGLQELQYLNLKGNRISDLNYRLFKFNPELISIDFSDNFIKFIAEDLLVPFDHLKFIDFSNNICVKNQPASDNFREWDRELRRNCAPGDKYQGVAEPLWRIAESVNANNGLNGFNG